jgi:hypothetical protein
MKFLHIQEILEIQLKGKKHMEQQRRRWVSLYTDWAPRREEGNWKEIDKGSLGKEGRGWKLNIH